MGNARKAAIDALFKVDTDLAYSNITLNNIFKERDLSAQDKQLATAIFYGVLDRQITLDYILQKYMKLPLKKTDKYTVCVLRAGLYQIMYMDKIPDSAAVDESVEIIKKSNKRRNAGFVNGLLRSIIRNGTQLPDTDSAEDMSIRYSCPQWIVREFISDYGIADTKGMLEASLLAPPVNIRVNTLRITTDDLINEFAKLNIRVSSGEVPDSLVINSGIDISNNALFRQGLFYVQDISSQKCALTLDMKSGERMLDMCAAPGGKSFTAALCMENKGEIVGCDLYSHRVELIKKGAQRLGIDIVKPTVMSATEFSEDLGRFDAVLCDVPCSGLGVIRRKPELKYKKAQDFSDLEKIQSEILCNGARYLKKNGRIVYSTCTVRKAENEHIVKAFLDKNKDFKLISMQTALPHKDNADGFFTALMAR